MKMAGGKQTDTGQLPGTELHQVGWMEIMAPVTKADKDTWEDKVFHPAPYEFVISSVEQAGENAITDSD